MTFDGPIAGGPWHGSNMSGRDPIITCPILRPAERMRHPPKSVKLIGDIQAANYRWHQITLMWIWEGPDVPIRKSS